MHAAATIASLLLLCSIIAEAFVSPTPTALSIESCSRIQHSCIDVSPLAFDLNSFDVHHTLTIVDSSPFAFPSHHDNIDTSIHLLSTAQDDTATHLLPSIIDTTSLLLTSNTLASTLGYFVGIASLLLYTPIAIRLLRTKSADGLALSTWWCKLTAFTCTDVYNIKSGFPLAAFSETIVITVEALVVLCLVTYYQKKLDGTTVSLAGVYCICTAWALLSPQNADWGPSSEVIATAQIIAAALNSAALLPQLYQNFARRSSGGYSPVTAALGSGGCTIRLFTTFQLAGGDPLMLLNYGVALLLNLSVLMQVVYFGVREEKRSLTSLFLADLR